ncbi:hypothetical protein BCR44DRAFT_1012051 [Catenaria anguillulae PL171]|uniref:Uncharacterized protein n=1 Tax=Catenaria anguillulae PL171 TaxID=765915 RepID=A0A1Y2I4K6_9FUNG|nr:hypothetical protein BCR44DRAFT_1012051 [Catenaria anguillulae PL171]
MNMLSKSKHFHRHHHNHTPNPSSTTLLPTTSLPVSSSSSGGGLSFSLASGSGSGNSGGGKHHATQRKQAGSGSKRSSTSGGANANAMKKGTSLNHLLNFTLPPRQVQQPLPASANARKSSSRAAPRGAGGAAWAAVHSKERFINANFRFVVKPEGSYVKQIADPDVPIDWDLVDQVIMPTTDLPACPICLTSPPTAPRITKCGQCFVCPAFCTTTRSSLTTYGALARVATRLSP